jgi:hypothetical protein
MVRLGIIRKVYDIKDQPIAIPDHDRCARVQANEWAAWVCSLILVQPWLCCGVALVGLSGGEGHLV